MDLSFNVDDKVFNYRVAGIIRNGDKILVTTRHNKDYVTLIGGRVKFGEASSDAIVREIKEEMGCKVDFIKTLGIIENFFKSKYDKIYHEMLVINEISFKDKSLYHEDSFCNYEEDGAEFTWKSIDELKKLNFQPKDVLDYLDCKEMFHIIKKDV